VVIVVVSKADSATVVVGISSTVVVEVTVPVSELAVSV
jgi:hypothetical protein